MVRVRAESVYSFLSDEQGGGSVVALFWFVLTVGVCGLAVDMTDGFRNRSMLQTTADAAALAGAIDLPNSSIAVASAVSYSRDNLATGKFDPPLQPEDITIGTWDRATRTVVAGGESPDAVVVRLHRTLGHPTAVPVNLLRLAGLMDPDIDVLSVAQRYLPDCLRDGLIADRKVDISSRNGFVGKICIHGQQGVSMQEHNYFEPGVTVSMPNPARMLSIAGHGMDNSMGLPLALRPQSFNSRLVPNVGVYMDDLLAQQEYVTPPYVDASLPVIVKDETWDFGDLTLGRIYHVQCAPNEHVGIPNGTVLLNVAIISDCQIVVGSGVTMIDAILGSRAAGTSGGSSDPDVQNANISFSSSVNLGLADNCRPGGGVQVFSTASVDFSPSMSMNGVQVIARGNVNLGARELGINGVNIHAGHDIRLASSNMFGLCSGGSPQFFPVSYYRLVV